MSGDIKDDPWGEFWKRNVEAGARAGNGETGGCLPQRWAAIENAQKSAWLSLVDNLPEGARVLDLATGDSRVLRWMQAARGDLALTGIDLAPQLPPPPPGIETHSGVAMEALPFGDDSFDAVVSQFGFEYGDTAKVADAIARVLAPHGRVALIVHRGDGPILEHNMKRRSELLWALGEKSAARKVKTALKDGAGAIDRAASIAEKIAAQGAKKFGQGSPAWEIPEAIRRSCLMGRNAGVGSITETIGMIEAQAKNELGRIKSLAGACRTADDRSAITAAFAAHGLELMETRELCEPSGRAIADFIRFS